MAAKRFSGVLVPVLTPFKADLSPDKDRFVKICKWMLANGATALAPFGTTSEANSMAVEERMELLEALIEGGVPGEKLMPGAGTCNLTDNVKIAKHAVKLGCGGVLMLPPFYYKGATDEGLFAMFSESIQRIGSANLQVYLYHIPPQAVTPISLKLIGMLTKAYPATVVGLKDSSGDWNNTQAVLTEFPGFTVFPGSELFLLQGMRAGAAGCITASGNINPTEIRKVYDNWKTDQADALQDRITTVRKAVQAYPMIPALKRICAHFWKDEAWSTVRPPLMKLSPEKSSALLEDLKKINWTLPGTKA